MSKERTRPVMVEVVVVVGRTEGPWVQKLVGEGVGKGVSRGNPSVASEGPLGRTLPGVCRDGRDFPGTFGE